MLSDSTIAIVKSTAPVLEQMGETLTRHFYERLFRHHPEVAPFFNRANQTKGAQQKALAGAICAFAANVDNLAALGGAVELIAQKHASLQVKPEHYPIVGEHLLASIREVLGAAATEEIVSAWAEAYGFLADIMIGREKQLYREHAAAPHGWTGFKPFKVIRKEAEGEAITSFYLQPADGQAVPLFKPGQYITVRVPSPDGSTTMRNYSLSDKPGQPWFRLSIKRERARAAASPDGYVSSFLHDTLEVGDSLEVGPPCGEFFLDVTEKHVRPLVLLSAGVGTTPLMSILLSVMEATPDRPVVFIHANFSHQVHAFRETVEQLAAKHPSLRVHYRYEEVDEAIRQHPHISEGRIDAELIESFVPEHDADYYFCGPQPFMVKVYHQLLTWGMPASQAHFEFFGPRQELERAA
jgi:nitric oxide dioxygenase